MPHEHWKWDRAGLSRRALQQPTQSCRNPIGNEGITIPPQVNPGCSLLRDLTQQCRINGKISSSKAFFSDGIGGGEKKTIGTAPPTSYRAKRRASLIHHLNTCFRITIFRESKRKIRD